MNDKYFTPSLEDIRVGYECETWLELHEGAEWKKDVLQEFAIGDILEDLKAGYDYVRVPYLTKEQILEDESWIEDTTEGWDKGSLAKVKENGNLYRVFVRRDYTIYISQFIPAKKDCLWCTSMKSTIYDGQCKDINTFRYICKLLNI